MRRILITPYVLTIASQYSNHIKSENIIGKLNNLKQTLLPQPNSADYINYVNYIINNFYKILSVVPDDFDTYDPIKQLHLNITLCRKFPKADSYGNIHQYKFHELVVDALSYDKIRNCIYPIYISKLGIRTCVYCNAQYAISIKRDKGDYTSSFQLDHFLPKSKYPYLAISFFNLQPSCGHCNQLKSKNKSLFNLYTNRASDVQPFRFNIDRLSLLQFLLTADSENLKINITSTNSSLMENHEKRFHVNVKYEKHKEEASDIVLLSRFYNRAYLNQLHSQFSSIMPHFRNQILNILLGFPVMEEDVHKRPLTLMRQDIAKQLNVL